MPVVFYCSGCQKRFTADDDLIGKRVRCKNCGLKREVPAVSELQEVVEPWVVTCSSCQRNHYPKPEHEGKRIRCRCGQIMRLTRGTAVVEESMPSLVPLDENLLAGSSPVMPHAAEPFSPVAAWSADPLATPSPNASHELPSSLGNQVAPPRFSPPKIKTPEEIRAERKKRERALIRKSEKGGRSDTSDEGGAIYRVFGVIGGLVMIVVGVWVLIHNFNNPDDEVRGRKGPFALIVGGVLLIGKSLA